MKVTLNHVAMLAILCGTAIICTTLATHPSDTAVASGFGAAGVLFTIAGTIAGRTGKGTS